LFTSVRIGFEGQLPNFALFERNVPYIYNEIIFGTDSDGRDTQNQVRMSVDKVWSQIAGDTGLTYFNEIRIFRWSSSVNKFVLETSPYQLGGGANMLQPFIHSIPDGQWTTLPPQPSVQSIP
jgi:hypothetical protein